MPLETCQKYTATLSEILAITPVVQTIADATDVPGVRLEWLNGAWYGDCGFPSAAQHSALLAANAYNSLGVGSRVTLPSGPVTWHGAAAGGWVTASHPGAVSFGLPVFNSATKPRIFVYGDSNGAGQGSANRNYAFPSVTAALLGWRDGAFFGYGRMGAAFDPRTNIGGFTATTAKDAPGSMLTCAGSSSSDFQFSPGMQFDSFDFWYPRTGAANTQVVIKVDGVVIDTINQSGTNALLRKTYAVAQGVHTIAIQSTGTGTAYILGIETHDSTSNAPEMCNCSISAANMSDLTTVANPWSNLIALQTLAPSAVILHCTINDLDNAVTPATLRGLIDTFVNTVYGYGIDLILTNSWAWTNSALSTDGTLDNISEFLKKSASAVKGAWVDMRYAVGASGAQTAARGWKFDNWHLTASGYAKYAPLLARVFLT